MKMQTGAKEFDAAVEIAKAACANSSDENLISAAGANKVADFIETLYLRFTDQADMEETN